MTARLPTVGGDDGDWGTVLNTFLEVSHDSEGKLLSGAITEAGGYIKPGTGIPSTDMSSAVQSALTAAGNTVQLSGDIGGTTASPHITATHLSAALPVNQGGTGSATQNFVDLTTSQTKTGSLMAPLLDNGGAVYNVKAYGAKGDGTTVDSAAIQSAISAALAANAGTVYFPAGTYVVSGITFGSNITVKGAGIGATVLLMNPASSSGSVVCRVAPASSSISTSNCVVQDLTIDGNKSIWGNNSNQKGYGYYLGQGTQGLIAQCKITNVEIRNCLTYAFDIENTTDITVENCWAHDNGYTTGTGTEHTCDGFTVIGSDVTLSDCRAYNNSHNGYLVGQDGFTWYRCKLIACTAGGNNLHGAALGSDSSGFLYDSAIIGGSFISSTTGDGIQLGTNAQRCTVSGAACTGNSQNGIRITGSAYNTVTGCTVYNNATSGSSNPEIYLTGTSTNNVIAGNVIDSSNAANAITEQNSSSDYNAITGNSVTATGTTISVAGTHTLTSNNVGFNGAASNVTIDTTASDIKPAGTQNAGAVNKAADAGHIHPATQLTPAGQGLLAWTYGLEAATLSSIATAGTLYLARLDVPYNFTATNIWFGISTGGSGTSTGSYVGLYNSAGTLLSGSADIASTITSSGNKQVALTTPQALTAGSFVWVSFLCNLSTTQATPRSGSLALNLGLAATGLRAASNGTSLTSLPASITPSSNSSAAAYWFGIS